MVKALTHITFRGRKFVPGDAVDELPASVIKRLAATGAVGGEVRSTRTLAEWTLAMPPSEYLARYPSGEHAPLARQWAPYSQYVDESADPDEEPEG